MQNWAENVTKIRTKTISCLNYRHPTHVSLVHAVVFIYKERNARTYGRDWDQWHAIYRKAHYNDVIIGPMASQTISLTIVYSAVYSKKTAKLRVTGLWAGNSPGTGEFPAHRASNAENVPFDDVTMLLSKCTTLVSISLTEKGIITDNLFSAINIRSYFRRLLMQRQMRANSAEPATATTGD